MCEVNNMINLELSGRIDSNNAHTVEEKLLQEIAGRNLPVVLDASKLEYISSAGLRILLRIRKTNPDLKMINVNSDVFEILEMTGFTEMMDIEKAYRVISLENCEEIGRGANGSIYRIDQDTVVKIYNNPNALDDIRHEREVARLALILGIPTAISYDVVKVEDNYGSVFEMLNAQSFSKIIAEEPDKLDWCVSEYVKMLKKIHSTVVPEGKLPDIKETVLSWAKFLQDYLPAEAGKKLLGLVEAVPHDNHMIHGDYHTKNLVLQNDEVLLIDMDTLAVGNPIFELGSIFNAFIGFSELDHTVIQKFQGFDFETGKKFFHDTLAAYLGTANETKIREVEDKARIIGYARLIRRSIRRHGLETEQGRKEIDFWKEKLITLLEKTDTLVFRPNELETEAVVENLDEVLGFIDENLDAADCSPKVAMQIRLAAEEIFVNIASYAYQPEKGKAIVRVEITEDPLTVAITFIDHGIPYDPLKKADPDITLSAEERDIGGLGVFLAKKTMDDVTYEYKDGQNILKLKKSL